MRIGRHHLNLSSRIVTRVLQHDHGNVSARRKRLGMIAAQPLKVAFEKLMLDRCCSFVVALCDEKISQSSDCAQAQIVVPAEMPPHIPDDSF